MFSWLLTFACGFREALRHRDRDGMNQWIRNAIQSRVGPLLRFGYGLLRRDHDAIMAAVEFPWSSGQVDGQINRLKAIKRQQYGRAAFTCFAPACYRIRLQHRREGCSEFAEEPILTWQRHSVWKQLTLV